MFNGVLLLGPVARGTVRPKDERKWLSRGRTSNLAAMPL